MPLEQITKLNIISSSNDHYYDDLKNTLKFIPEGYFEGKPIGDLKPIITLFEDKESLYADETKVSLEIEEQIIP